MREGIVRDDDELKALNKRIIALGEKLNKPVVATGDVHFLRKRERSFQNHNSKCKGLF